MKNLELIIDISLLTLSSLAGWLALSSNRIQNPTSTYHFYYYCNSLLMALPTFTLVSHSLISV